MKKYNFILFRSFSIKSPSQKDNALDTSASRDKAIINPLSENIESAIETLLSESESPQVSSSKRILSVKNHHIYVDYNESLFINKKLLTTIYKALCEILPSMKSDETHNISIILIEPLHRKIFLPLKYKHTLESFIDKTNAYEKESLELSIFPHHSRIKSHIKFINNYLNKWIRTINFTESNRFLPKNIIKKMEDLAQLFQTNKCLNLTVKFNIICKKRYFIKQDAINENTIIIDADNSSIESFPYTDFIKRIETAHLYKQTLNKNRSKPKLSKNLIQHS